ncbi:MAG TPA: porin family protein [Paludibacter sp.]
MRKNWIFIFILFSTSLIAQVRLDKPEIYVGVTAGATGSMVIFNPVVAQTYLQGYNGGLVFRYIAEKNVGMQAELNFSQRGWKEANGLFTKQLNYIELPFLTHIYMGKKNRFFINLGPKISYLLSEKVLVNGTTNSTETQQTTAVQNAFDYGLCGGIGFLFNIKGNQLQLDTRAYYALSDIYSNNKKDYFDNSNNANLSVNLAWLIQIK